MKISTFSANVMNTLNSFQRKDKDNSEEMKEAKEDQASALEKQNTEKETVLEDMKRQLEEMTKKNNENTTIYLQGNKKVEEYPVGGSISSGMFNLLSAKNKLGDFRALKGEVNFNNKDDKSKINIKTCLFEDINNEVKKAVKIGIKEAEAERINKKRSNKSKIKKIKIEVNEAEQDKAMRALSKYLNNVPEEPKKADNTDTMNKVNSIDKRA